MTRNLRKEGKSRPVPPPATDAGDRRLRCGVKEQSKKIPSEKCGWRLRKASLTTGRRKAFRGESYLRMKCEGKEHFRLHLGQIRGRHIVQLQQAVEPALLVGRGGQFQHLHALHEVSESLIYLPQHVQVRAQQLDHLNEMMGAKRRERN